MNGNLWRWMRGVAAAVCAGFLAALVTGCDPAGSSAHEPDQVRILSADPQFGLPTDPEPKRVRLEVLSAPINTLLGRPGSRQLVAGARLLLRPVDPRSGLLTSTNEVVTDSGGRAEFTVTLGPEFGDQYLEAVSASRPAAKARLRFVSGVRVTHNKQEVTAGQTLPDPFRVTLLDAAAQPLVGVPVYFTLTSQPHKGAKLKPALVLTDSEGVAEAELETVAGVSGTYRVNAEIADPTGGRSVRPVSFEVSAIHFIGLIIGVLGGLAIFVYGVTLMSDGLQQVAGHRLKKILAYITGNHVMAVFAGAAVTGLIQSSSGTTVMTIGFVNASLLTLKQAIGVIFGANIGTTITGQMVSFSLEGLALPATALGVLLLLTLKRPAAQGLARTILGFGLLFYGMGMMSAQLKSISGFSGFARFFQSIDCQPLVAGGTMPLGAVLGAVGIGTLVTVLMQSSSATIGLTIALANSGLLNIWTAVPIILGDNIGTTITAILASLGANRTAKQAAIAHTLFNVIGTVVIVALFYVSIGGVPCFLYAIDHITSGDVFSGENLGRHVAAAHSLFNVFTVILFTPFIGALAWLCVKLVPSRAVTPRAQHVHLDKSWLASPSVALGGAVRATAAMTEKAGWVALTALEHYHRGKPAPMDEIARAESETDDTQRQIMDYLMQLTRRKLSASQTQAIPALMHCVADAERIADIGVTVAELVPLVPNGEPLTDAAQKELDEIMGKMRRLSTRVLEGLGGAGKEAIESAVRLEGQVRMLCKQGEQGHIERLQRGECTIDRGVVYVEVLALVEAIVRHYGNIATRTAAATTETDYVGRK